MQCNATHLCMDDADNTNRRFGHKPHLETMNHTSTTSSGCQWFFIFLKWAAHSYCKTSIGFIIYIYIHIHLYTYNIYIYIWCITSVDLSCCWVISFHCSARAVCPLVPAWDARPIGVQAVEQELHVALPFEPAAQVWRRLNRFKVQTDQKKNIWWFISIFCMHKPSRFSNL